MPKRPTHSLILPASRKDGREHRVGQGLWVSRRELLAWCGAGVATAALASASQARAASLGFDDFIAAANDAAEALLQDQSAAGQEGGRGLDITTRLKPKLDYSVPYLDLGERPDVGPADGVFRSRRYRR